MTLSLSDLARHVAAGSVPLPYAVAGDEWLRQAWSTDDDTGMHHVLVATCDGVATQVSHSRHGGPMNEPRCRACAAAIRALRRAPTLAALLAATEAR